MSGIQKRLTKIIVRKQTKYNIFRKNKEICFQRQMLMIRTTLKLCLEKIYSTQMPKKFGGHAFGQNMTHFEKMEA